MDVLFIDVGFGTCNIILTGSGEAIVIDGGERSKEPLTALHHFNVKRLRHLIVSHWHGDHVGGATGILEAYRGKVGHVWYPPGANFHKTNFWRAVNVEYTAGRLGDYQIKSLSLQDKQPTTIWESNVQDADLCLASPSFIEVNRGVAAEDQNATSGVIILRVGTNRIIFAGDATLSQWERLQQRMPAPITTEVLAVPHHAGIIWPNHWKKSEISTALHHLYSDIVRPKVGVISVGTRPGKHHPRTEVIEALRKAGASVMCTQMTHRCSSDLESVRASQTIALPVLVPGGRSSVVPHTTSTGYPNHVACAGTVFVELLASGSTVRQFTDHQAFVDTLPLAEGINPICRR